MLLWRYTTLVRPECTDEIVALFKGELERSHLKGRVSVPVYGVNNTVVMEGEFESLAAHEAFFQEYWQTPEAQQAAPVMDAGLLPQGTNEIWEIRLSEPNPQPVKLLERLSATVKNGKVNDLVELVTMKEEQVHFPMQLLSCVFGPTNAVELAFEFTGPDEQKVFWDAFGKRDDTKLFFEKWDALVIPGGHNQVLEVR